MGEFRAIMQDDRLIGLWKGNTESRSTALTTLNVAKGMAGRWRKNVQLAQKKTAEDEVPADGPECENTLLAATVANLLVLVVASETEAPPAEEENYDALVNVLDEDDENRQPDSEDEDEQQEMAFRATSTLPQEEEVILE